MYVFFERKGIHVNLNIMGDETFDKVPSKDKMSMQYVFIWSGLGLWTWMKMMPLNFYYSTVHCIWGEKMKSFLSPSWKEDRGVYSR